MPKEASPGYSIHKGKDEVGMDSAFSSMLLVNKDRVRLKVIEYRSRLMILVQFASSLSLFLSTIGVTLTAGQFRDFAGVPGVVWEAAYVLITIASALWLAISAKRMFGCWRKLDAESVMQDICTTEPLGPNSQVLFRIAPNFDVTPVKPKSRC